MYRVLFCIFIITTVTLAQFSHRAVLENDALEETLPAHYKNPFLRTPRVRQALAIGSWLGPGEKIVQEREAEKIPRHEIYSVLVHAGLVPRRFFK